MVFLFLFFDIASDVFTIAMIYDLEMVQVNLWFLKMHLWFMNSCYINHGQRLDS